MDRSAEQPACRCRCAGRRVRGAGGLSPARTSLRAQAACCEGKLLASACAACRRGAACVADAWCAVRIRGNEDMDLERGAAWVLGVRVQGGECAAQAACCEGKLPASACAACRRGAACVADAWCAVRIRGNEDMDRSAEQPALPGLVCRAASARRRTACSPARTSLRAHAACCEGKLLASACAACRRGATCVADAWCAVRIRGNEDMNRSAEQPGLSEFVCRAASARRRQRVARESCRPLHVQPAGAEQPAFRGSC